MTEQERQGKIREEKAKSMEAFLEREYEYPEPLCVCGEYRCPDQYLHMSGRWRDV